MLINGEWSLQRAVALAARIQREQASEAPREQVLRAYRLCFGRGPTADEMMQCLQFLQSERAHAAVADTLSSNSALVSLCHVLLNANEFLYID